MLPIVHAGVMSPVFPGRSKFRTKIAVTNFLRFSCGLLVRSCWAELKYTLILRCSSQCGEGVGALIHSFPKFGETESPVFLVLKPGSHSPEMVSVTVNTVLWETGWQATLRLRWCLKSLVKLHFPQLISSLMTATMHFAGVHTYWLYGTADTLQESENQLKTCHLHSISWLFDLVLKCFKHVENILGGFFWGGGRILCVEIRLVVWT